MTIDALRGVHGKSLDDSTPFRLIVNVTLGQPAEIGSGWSKSQPCPHLAVRETIAIAGSSRGGTVRPKVALRSYLIECRPIMLLSVSSTKAMKPYCPMENFSFTTLPPCRAARPASTAQSAHEK